jgi:hypothetical protein
MAKHDIHEARALRANLATSATTVVLQADAMVLDLEELLVERKPFRRIQLPLGTELLFGVSENFFAMSKHGVKSEALQNAEFPEKRDGNYLSAMPKRFILL